MKGWDMEKCQELCIRFVMDSSIRVDSVPAIVRRRMADFDEEFLPDCRRYPGEFRAVRGSSYAELQKILRVVSRILRTRACA